MPKKSDGPSSRMEAARQQLIADLRKRISDERVTAAMARTPRELFVPAHVRDLTYEDSPLAIGCGQTISQPYVVALMLEALELKGEETVLEIGTGSGYQAVLLSQLARRVVSVERIRELAEEAARLIKGLGCVNVQVELAGDTLGCPLYAPYQAIVVSAGAPKVPKSLVDQLCTGGRMVLPVGSREEQDLKRVIRLNGELQISSLGPCRFVPLIGEESWAE